MSMVYNFGGTENIYNVEKPILAEVKQPPIYYSKFKQQVRQEMSSAKDSHRTMGYAQTPLRNPTKFLRKSEGIRIKKEPSHECCKKSHNLPPVPQINSPNAKPARSHNACYNYNLDKSNWSKNFKIENIKRVATAVPAKPKPKFVDTKNGDIQELRSSGLFPVYVFYPKYGKVPNYLINRSKILSKQQLAACKYEVEKSQTGAVYVAQEQRAEILNGLRRNWEELQKVYQALPVMTDTVSKKNRRAKLERELRELEQDILLVERNLHIFVCNPTDNN